MKTAELRKIDPNLPLCLVIADDQQERDEAVNAYIQDESLVIEPESFERFGQEVETIPMHATRLLLRRVDQLKKGELEQVIAYAGRPNQKIFLCMTAASLSGRLVAAVDKQGVVYHLPKEKPWERERRLASTLSEEAGRHGVVFPLDVATDFVKAFGTEKSLLIQELEKLICYVSDRKEITRDDLRAISTPISQQTLWELADAIFVRNFVRAHTVMQGLLLEGVNIFPILSSLRSQVETAKRVLALAQQGGQPSVQKEFPYLKGRLYDRKLALFRQYGEARLSHCTRALFYTELEARSSQHQPGFILEKLLVSVI